MRRLSLVVAVSTLFAWVLPAEALLAVFTDGRVLRVTDARLEGDQLILDLPDGGVLTIPAVRIDRVVSDEVEPGPRAALPSTTDCPWVWVDEPLPEAMPFGSDIKAAARDAGLHPWLVVAVVEAESAFDPQAVSRAGAQGLMQLMPAAALDHGVDDPFDPAANLRGGSRHLRRMIDRFEDLQLALAAYNAGATTVDRYGEVPPYRETRSYVRRVLEDFCQQDTAVR